MRLNKNVLTMRTTTNSSTSLLSIKDYTRLFRRWGGGEKMNYNYRRPYPNELIHYGIIGQKHGVRRFQNYDGTLTPAGIIRYRDKNEDGSDHTERLKGREKYVTEATGEIFRRGDGIDIQGMSAGDGALTILGYSHAWNSGKIKNSSHYHNIAELYERHNYGAVKASHMAQKNIDTGKMAIKRLIK